MTLHSFIDHTVLKPIATQAAIRTLCEEAIVHEFASVCVNPVHVAFAAELLKGKSPVVCTVIGFPLGANTLDVKVFEAKKAIADGATEIDMVINIGAAVEHNYEYVEKEIAAIVQIAKNKALVKVIIETCFLSDDEIIQVSQCCVRAGADFVKTSTGFGSGGAKAEHVTLMKQAVNGKIRIKASGGIRSKRDAEKMIAAGANRLGTSCGIAIVSD